MMLRFFETLHVDRISFWIGFAAATLFWWVALQLRPRLPILWKALKERILATRKGLTASAEERYRKDVLRVAQRSHLSAALFSLDEILVTPHLIAPPPQVNPGQQDPAVDVYAQVVPYLPEWPDLPAALQASELTLTQALEGGANLVLVGNPGSGKTVALAHLASIIARQEPAAGNLADFIPILVHAPDFNLPNPKAKGPLDILIEAASAGTSVLSQTRLPALLKAVCEKGRGILLLDGLDELHPDHASLIGEFLGDLLKHYPALRVVAAASPEFIDGLAALRLRPVAIAAWDSLEREAFVHQWSDLWARYAEQSRPGASGIDPLFLESWLTGADPFFNPLEATLKVWAAFAGDVLGSTPANAIEAYLLRMTVGIPKARPVLEKLALQAVSSMTLTMSEKEADQWARETETAASVSPFGPDAGPFTEAGSEADPAEEISAEPTSAVKEKDAKKAGKTAAAAAASAAQGALPQLLSGGLFISRRDGRVSFAHPVLAGYLAGAALAASGGIENLCAQPDWSGKLLALQYTAGWNDISEITLPMLDAKDDPLHRQVLRASRWLRESPKNARWRSAAMRRLATLLQQDILSLGLRARVMAALACSGDPGVSVLFRQALVARQGSVRQLAALGCGMLRDAKAINDLVVLLNDSETEVALAALLALSAIGTDPAMEAIADILLQGSEDMRRAAAEIMANRELGREALREGSTMEDLVVRRAVVYGLARVREPWAIQTLEKMQIEDGQWVVRSAATEALEVAQAADPHIPKVRPEIANLPWLLVFAGKLGVGVVEGKQANDLLFQMLKNGSEEEQLAAMEVLTEQGGEELIPPLYHLLFGAEGRVREAAFTSIAQLASTGLTLPAPAQFGLG